MTNGKGWTFIPLPDEEQYAIVSDRYWDENESLDENEAAAIGEILPEGFYEASECHYDHMEGYEAGLAVLRQAGFREIARPSGW